MPERAINPKSATGCLLVLIPAALTMSALFVAWPVILGVTLLIAGGNIWQSYEWSKTVRSIDPVFQQSIVQYRGEITPLDLAVKANIPGTVANRYLAAKANEFGTSSRQHPERGQVYYFVSISTLGSIFDDSEAEIPELMPAANPVVAFQYPSVPAELVAPVNVTAEALSSVATIAASPQLFEPAAPAVTRDPISSPPIVAKAIPAIETHPDPAVTVDPIVSPLAVAESTVPTAAEATLMVTPEPMSLRQALARSDEPMIAEPQVVASPAISSESTLPAETPVITILQSDLAKRLDVHSSTVYKRRSEPNFTDWTRNRDPDGTGWGYSVATKEYYRVDT
ncbi:hypothetical protein [Chamaesiphon sp. VAR_69_metabat_338]|uniref:hypothetical protein n=1 Tax=Chamaesiphon sp. VAR_69_metabat_338 TaxID=2964704 RepID=UPI00286E1938|nr:hypothetical protein [Chamaesiphon sp. VAR_69_metabat_338]